jgi:hypothetical protein
MSKNIAELQRELNAYMIEGNDYMVEKIQKIIDAEYNKRNSQNLNEVVASDSDTNIQNLNEG